MPAFRSNQAPANVKHPEAGLNTNLAEEQPPPFFENNEKVLCFHGPLIYEGKTLKTEYREGISEYAYFIHYAGWSKNWDEWVVESRVMKYSEDNLEKQKMLKQAHAEQQQRAPKKTSIALKSASKKRSSNVGSISDSASIISASDSRSSTPIMDQKGAKTGRKDSIKSDTNLTEGEPTPAKKKKHAEVETEARYEAKQEIQIELPEQLRVFLIDDWDNIVRQRRLVKLPARLSVEQILENYMKTRKKGDMYAVELCNGIREYFNCMIGSQLLYRYEREQFQEAWQTYYEEAEIKKEMSDIYGVAHLVRLFSKIGDCLAYTNLDVEGTEILQSCFDDFLKFIVKNYDEYISLEDYGVLDPEYQRQVPV